MAEPLFHRAKWTADDRARLVRAVMRGGDWVRRSALDLGRSEGAVLREALRLIEDGPVPPGFREAVYRVNTERRAPRIPVEKTPVEKERMARSFEAMTGHAIREQVVPKSARLRYTPENGFVDTVASIGEDTMWEYPITRAEAERIHATGEYPADLEDRPRLRIRRVEWPDEKSTDDVSEPQKPARWERLWRWLGGE